MLQQVTTWLINNIFTIAKLVMAKINPRDPAEYRRAWLTKKEVFDGNTRNK